MKQPTVKVKKINIWQYQYILARRLIWWGVLSFAFGVPLLFMEKLLRGFGIQAIAWGLVDAGIAVGGSYLTTKRYKSHPDPSSKEIADKESQKLQKLLWWMVPMDVIYILVGAILIFSWGRKDNWWLGTGIGVIVQGLFLLGFDWYHVKNVPAHK